MSLFVKMQAYAPLKFSTWCFGTLAKIRIPFIKNYFIRKCIAKYDINMDEVLNPDIHSYKNFNDFFTRRLKPNARTWAPAPALPSPVDGFISQIGTIEKDTIIQAKGLDYTVAELLADASLAKRFEHGNFANLYLSPRDYHRVHMPMDANLTAMTFVPGKHFSVSPDTVSHYPKLFAQNERLVCHYETAHGPMVIILVGALNVASMFTSWEDKPIRYAHTKTIHYHPPKSFQRGDELGGFLMGSTVIMLFAPNRVRWDENLHPAQAIKMGQRLGEI